MAKLFFITVTIVVPIAFLVFAVVRRHVSPLLLGVMAFVVSQMVIRLPLLNFLASESSTYQLLSITKPILMMFFLAFTAGLAEEVARWIFMRYFMRIRSVQNGVVFGMGHGGIEALLLVGIPMLGSATMMLQPQMLVLSGIERICAILIHICLSVLVLMGVRKRAFRYCMYAILIHTLINFTSGILANTQSLVIVELVLAVLTALLVVCTIRMIGRNKNDEKMDGFIQ